MSRPAARSTAARDRQHGTNDVEVAAEQELRGRHPHLAGSFPACLAAARAKVLGRLWGAVWREGLPGLAGRAERQSGRDAVLVLDDGTRLVAPTDATEPFGRYPAGLAVHRHDPAGRPHPVHHPVDLLDTLRLPDRDGRVSRLRDELAGSVANLALALVAGQHRAEAAPGRGRDRVDPLVWAEQAVVEGHPLHPCCRTRSGMTAGDVLDHAPEWGPVVSLPVLAVRRDHYTGRGDLTRLLTADHPGLAGAAPAGPDGYALLPVHPWQLRHVLLRRYAHAVAAGVLRVLPDVALDAHPLMSLRTLAPVGPGSRCHLKTALDVQMTSAVRTVSAAAVRNGPTLSVLLAEVARREGGWHRRFALLAEPASGCYLDPDQGPSPSLAAVAREPAAAHLAAGEVAVPVAALAAPSPSGGGPLLADALRSARLDAAGWLSRYCRVVLPPLLTLLTRWGIALEAHGQNTLVVLRDGLPVRVLYRDLGGVRVSPRRLARHGLAPPLPGDLPTDDPDELRAKLAASLVSTQLAELVAVLADLAGTGRAALWEVAAGACEQAYALLAGEPDAAGDRRALLAGTAPVKAMLSMRLAAEATADRWVWLPNPLAGAR